MGVIKLAPSEIRFSQDSISNSFGANTYHAGQYIGETLDEIVRNPDTADRIPNISVFNIDGTWITSDNRRLWVFQKAEELGIVCFIDVSVKDRIYYAKFTTTSDGRCVCVRGNNSGGHLWQSLQRQMIEKQARQQKEIEWQRRVREREKEIERQRRAREREMEIERQRRVRELEMEIERQRRVREREMEIERQRRVREREMEIERQRRVNIRNWIIIIVVLLLFLYWATRK
jgi:hypothetical protein